MNTPPSLDDDDGEVILDDMIIEEYELPSEPFELQRPKASGGGAAEKSHHLKLRSPGLLAVAALLLGSILIASAALLPRLRRGRVRWPRFARLAFRS